MKVEVGVKIHQHYFGVKAMSTPSLPRREALAPSENMTSSLKDARVRWVQIHPDSMVGLAEFLC